MFLKKKWLVMLAVITAVLLLGACGGKDAGGGDPLVGGSGPQDGSPADFMPLSEGFEKYSVWIQTDENPVRDSNVNKVFVFKKGKVTAYKLEDTAIEEIHDLSDDKLVQLASESTDKILDELVDKIDGRSISTDIKERHDESFKDIYLEVDGSERSPLSSKYTLDITLDELGQNTESIKLYMPDVYYQLDEFIQGSFIDYYAYSTDPNYSKASGAKDVYTEELKRLEEYGRFEDSSNPPAPDSYVPDPIEWETTDEELTFTRGMVKQTIFGTTFSGIATDRTSLLTRVDDSFVGFRLDNPDTKSKNVTIEGK
ncbi:hypothetical protein J8TS2_23180 [Lederbergia ruris]|uniref:Lipoprotein n=1 Tax=Lederbergia ruris TaxID=217495 RepID=A0ABQ4KLH4_9BACI|nr:hypothetical protein [Lederbergia ruris]GIN57999.1 hypothetical protein J8TS2_23180 [Lederbergia ruris]